MKIAVTGSLGNIENLLTKELVQKGHAVTIVSSKPERKKDTEVFGAPTTIDSAEDVKFLAKTFAGVDAVYCMLPGRENFTDPDFDLIAYGNMLANNYVQAIKQVDIKRVVYLSSVVANSNKDNGILVYHYNAETIMKTLPADVAITFMRPVGFYYNLLAFINTRKTKRFTASNYGADDTIPWVSPIDIATAVTEEITKPFVGRHVRYIASEEITCNQIASILGAAIGKPDLKWLTITNEQLQSGMVAMGMNPKIAGGFVEMNAALHNTTLFENYYRNQPARDKTKTVVFAKDFAAAFN